MADTPVYKIGHLKITDHLTLGITQHKLETGAETFQHFQLETKAYPGWNPLADDLRSGALDGAFILAPLSMELFHAGLKIKLILQGHKSGSTLIKNKRAHIGAARDFKGRAILIPHYLSVHHLLFDRLMRENGLEVGPGKDIIFDVTAPADIPEIMEWDEKGSVGGFIVAEPFGSQVVKAGYGEEYALSKDLWPNHPCCVLVMKQSLIDGNPAAVQELVNSLVASGQFIETNRDGAAAEIGAKFLGQDVAVIRRVLTQPHDRVTMGELCPVVEDFEYIQDYMTTKIEAMSQKINLNDFVDLRFAKAAGAK
jgi:NitT/TauT family transport system substrate-binding protein